MAGNAGEKYFGLARTALAVVKSRKGLVCSILQPSLATVDIRSLENPPYQRGKEGEAFRAL